MKLSEKENILPGSLLGGYTLLKTVAFLLGLILWTVLPSRRVCLIIILVCILPVDENWNGTICNQCNHNFKKNNKYLFTFSSVEFNIESRNLSTADRKVAKFISFILIRIPFEYITCRLKPRFLPLFFPTELLKIWVCTV
mgnify:CR=1 FL=1